MHLVLPEVLDDEQIQQIHDLLEHAPPGESWVDGTATSGTQSRGVKNNAQMPEGGRVTAAAREVLVAALNRHPLFVMAALPKRIYPPNFNRYAGAANAFGAHIDNTLRRMPSGGYMRCDLSCTVFLSDPGSYEGGELVVSAAGQDLRHKLQAGDAVLYPAGALHRVEPVTRGERVAGFFWVESLIRDTEQRKLLYSLDINIQRLRESLGETRECVALTQTYHRLLQMWATP